MATGASSILSDILYTDDLQHGEEESGLYVSLCLRSRSNLSHSFTSKVAPRRVYRPSTHDTTKLILAQHGPEFSAQQTWSELSKNIKEIQNHNASNLSFEENHRFAYNMVLYRQGEMLYKGVKSLISENLESLSREQVVPVFPSGASQEPLQKSNEAEMLLKALKSIWDDHRGNMSKLGQILKYMVSHHHC